MSRRFILTPSAARDIDEILEYVLESSGASRALHVHQRLL
jgi:plasmid stabilization system protein ParE